MKKTMLDYIRETPAVLLNNLDRAGALVGPLAEQLCSNQYHLVRLVASGSSANAAWCARPMLRTLLGMEVLVSPPYTFHHYECPPLAGEFPIIISQSGYSAGTLAALDTVRSGGRYAIGLTADLKGDIRAHCDLLVDYGAGEEQAGYVTKGVTALVLFLLLFGLEAGKRLGRVSTEQANTILADLENAALQNAVAADSTADFLKKNYMDLTAMGPALLCGAGPSYGVAREGALKLRELLQLPATAHELEEFLHGPELSLTPNHTVFFIDGGGSTSKRSIELWRAACRVTHRAFLIICGPAPRDNRVLTLTGGPGDLSSPLAILPIFQALAYHLTEDLHRWHKHPLCSVMERLVNAKTLNYVQKELL